MSITSNIANVASALTTGSLVNNLNADLLDGRSGNYYADLSNTFLDIASSAFNKANSAFDAANTVGGNLSSNVSLFDGINSTQNTSISSAFVQANSAFDVANTKFNSSGGTVTGDVIITGNVTVEGTTTTLNVDTLTIEDKNIILANVASPTDLTADGAGITILGDTNKTLNWVDSTDSWTSSENLDLASGKSYKINGVDVLDANTISNLQGVDNTQNTSISSAFTQANSAFEVANTATADIILIEGVNDTQNTNIGISYDQANTAFDAANSALSSALAFSIALG